MAASPEGLLPLVEKVMAGHSQRQRPWKTQTIGLSIRSGPHNSIGIEKDFVEKELINVGSNQIRDAANDMLDRLPHCDNHHPRSSQAGKALFHTQLGGHSVSIAMASTVFLIARFWF
jgi:hypothetical protein